MAGRPKDKVTKYLVQSWNGMVRWYDLDPNPPFPVGNVLAYGWASGKLTWRGDSAEADNE